MELSLLTYRAGQIPGGPGQIPGGPGLRLNTHLDNEIRLLPDITFTCPTVITSLALGIDVRREGTRRNQYPSVLRVRPRYNETNNEVIGYTLLTEQTIYYTPDNVSTNGVYNYPLDPPISVNIGDILGARAPGQRDSMLLLVLPLLLLVSTLRHNIPVVLHIPLLRLVSLTNNYYDSNILLCIEFFSTHQYIHTTFIH